jgi:hypothetical protein
MDTFPCHECRAPVEEGAVVWLLADGLPDDDGGEPYCPECATPLPLAA